MKILNKKRIIYIATIVIATVLLYIGNLLVYDDSKMFLGGYEDGASKAVVTEIINRDAVLVTDDYVDPDTGENVHVEYGESVTITFMCEVKSGDLKGQTVECVESISAYDSVPLKEVAVGDKILIAETNDGTKSYYMHNFYRMDTIIILLLILAALMILFGKTKGINTIISLALTCGAVFVVFVPAIICGYNVYFWSIITCVYIIVMTFLVVNGANKKSLSAAIGCTCGVVVAGVLTVLYNLMLNLSGITDEDTIYLAQSFEIDLKALIFAGIILGAVGAVMDVAMSISSSLFELNEKLDNPSFKTLAKSGITIGKDIMGTMANTLVLAYIGCELASTILSVSYSSSAMTLFSREKIVADLLQALVGSMGILLTIPLTAVISAFLYTHSFKFHQDKYHIDPPDEVSLFEKIDTQD